jgi:hypothetical protein
MMMRKTLIGVVALGFVAACQAPVPESNPQGAGFQDYNSYMRNSAAGVSGYGSPAATGMAAGAGTAGFSTDIASAAIDRAQGGSTAPLNGMAGAAPTATGSALPPIDSTACAGRGNAFAGIQETTSEMNAVGGVATAGVSDEQDFSAVTQRETIESDKQRIACNRQQYVVVQPGAIPQRPGDEGPNLAAYAIQTTNPPGVKLYSRPAFYLTNPQKACAKFTSSDKAQAAFLAAGGPQRDSKALDPDGDGFACAWDPRPFRAAK